MIAAASASEPKSVVSVSSDPKSSASSSSSDPKSSTASVTPEAKSSTASSSDPKTSTASLTPEAKSSIASSSDPKSSNASVTPEAKSSTTAALPSATSIIAPGSVVATTPAVINSCRALVIYTAPLPVVPVNVKSLMIIIPPPREIAVRADQPLRRFISVLGSTRRPQSSLFMKAFELLDPYIRMATEAWVNWDVMKTRSPAPVYPPQEREYLVPIPVPEPSPPDHFQDLHVFVDDRLVVLPDAFKCASAVIHGLFYNPARAFVVNIEEGQAYHHLIGEGNRFYEPIRWLWENGYMYASGYLYVMLGNIVEGEDITVFAHKEFGRPVILGRRLTPSKLSRLRRDSVLNVIGGGAVRVSYTFEHAPCESAGYTPVARYHVE